MDSLPDLRHARRSAGSRTLVPVALAAVAGAFVVLAEALPAQATSSGLASTAAFGTQAAASATVPGPLFEGAAVGSVHGASAPAVFSGSHVAIGGKAFPTAHRVHKKYAPYPAYVPCVEMWDPWYGFYPVCHGAWAFHPWAPVHFASVRFFRPIHRPGWHFSFGFTWSSRGGVWVDPWWGPTWYTHYVYAPRVFVPRVRVIATPVYVYRPAPVVVRSAPQVVRATRYMEDPRGSPVRTAVRRDASVSSSRPAAGLPPDTRVRPAAGTARAASTSAAAERRPAANAAPRTAGAADTRGARAARSGSEGVTGARSDARPDARTGTVRSSRDLPSTREAPGIARGARSQPSTAPSAGTRPSTPSGAPQRPSTAAPRPTQPKGSSTPSTRSAPQVRDTAPSRGARPAPSSAPARTTPSAGSRSNLPSASRSTGPAPSRSAAPATSRPSAPSAQARPAPSGGSRSVAPSTSRAPAPAPSTTRAPAPSAGSRTPAPSASRSSPAPARSAPARSGGRP